MGDWHIWEGKVKQIAPSKGIDGPNGRPGEGKVDLKGISVGAIWGEIDVPGQIRTLRTKTRE